MSSKNAILMWPKTIAGQNVQVTLLDDASDPGVAVRNIRKLVSEDKVDVVIEPNITPAALAALDTVAGAQTPMVRRSAPGRSASRRRARGCVRSRWRRTTARWPT